ncbi:MAG: SRPBCC domain-containing protein [Fimbriimonadaceae bacterium]|nr:SRPBCC domain-containing protein [Chitinophagales bacterium]
MKTKTIKQQIEFFATPVQLYNMLMDEKIHAAFTQAAAKISNSVGGKFTAWDGYISGKNIELIVGKKIVQEWTSTDMPDGHISIITFEFAEQKKGNTLIKFTHENVPADQYDELLKGWIDFYWEPMKQYLANLK